MKLKTGKLPPEFLRELVESLPCKSEQILIGPHYGVDGALVMLKEGKYVFTSDPITFTSRESVYYLFAVNINDTISMGAKPEFLAVNLLLREGITEEEVRIIFKEIAYYSNLYNVSVVTGHTEITPGLRNNVLSGFMVGKSLRYVSPEKVRPGDVIVQVKGIAIEGTSIIAREKESLLSEKFGQDFVERCKEFLFNPGICLYDVGLEILEKFEIHNLHDPTEGGIQTAIYETLTASNAGGDILGDEIIVYEETKKICDFFGINPLGLISSGTLIVILEEQEGLKMQDFLKARGIPSRIIGKVLPQEEGIHMRIKGKRKPLKPFKRDEILEVL